MKVTLEQLKKYIREAAEVELKEQDSDDGDSDGGGEEGMDESLSGSGWHGESQYLSQPSRDSGFSAETSEERRRRMERDAKSSKEFSDSYNQSSRYDESRKPKGLNLEALRKLVRETIEEDWTSSYSSGGSGGNRHGDSTDEEQPERAYRPESPAQREERLRRDDEREAYYGSRDTGWNESYIPKGKLTLEALRKMVRAAIRENVFEQAPPPPAPPAPPVPAAATAPVAPAAAPVAATPAAPVAAAPAAPADPNAAPPAAAPAAPVAEAVRRIVREAVRKHLQEKKEGKWMQKAGEEMEKKGTKGALHKQLGKKEGEKLSKSELESKKAALQKKGEGDKKLSAEDRKLLRRIIFALNAMKAKKD